MVIKIAKETMEEVAGVQHNALLHPWFIHVNAWVDNYKDDPTVAYLSEHCFKQHESLIISFRLIAMF